MSLKYKVSLLILLLFVISGVASVVINRLFIIPSFVELEQQQAHSNVERAVEAIRRDLTVLSTNVTAWAWWDASKQFMVGNNDEFVEAELSAEPVATAEVSYMGFYRMDGAQVIYRAPNATTHDNPGFGELQEASLPPNHPLLRFPDVSGDVKGIVSTSNGPMLVAARQILTSSGEGPPAGALIFGRLVDAATISRIAAEYKLQLTIKPVASTTPVSLATEFEEGKPQPARSAVTLRQDRDLTIGETTITDINNVPVLTIQVATPRTISEFGKHASSIALMILCGVAFTVLATLFALIHTTMLRPIGKLTAHAVEVGNTDALGKRLKLNRKDELGVLAKEFDRMTDHLAEARQRLMEQSFASGKADMAAGILHNLGNAVTPISVRLHTLKERIQAARPGDIERAVEELEQMTAAPDRQSDLIRFVQFAVREIAVLLRSAQEDVQGVVVQVGHVQDILAEQDHYSHKGHAVESIDMDQIIRQSVDGLNPELKSPEILHIDPSVRALDGVRGSRIEIRQVIDNLIINAAESIKSQGTAGGRISVSATREDADDAVVAHFVFDDNGVGIQPWHLKRIFDRRFSTKNRGSGVGLHWSANTVSALGGRLFAESVGAGKGARLHLILPLAEKLPNPMLGAVAR